MPERKETKNGWTQDLYVPLEHRQAGEEPMGQRLDYKTGKEAFAPMVALREARALLVRDLVRAQAEGFEETADALRQSIAKVEARISEPLDPTP